MSDQERERMELEDEAEGIAAVLECGEWCNYWTVGPNKTGFAEDPSPVPAKAAQMIRALTRLQADHQALKDERDKLAAEANEREAYIARLFRQDAVRQTHTDDAIYAAEAQVQALTDEYAAYKLAHETCVDDAADAMVKTHDEIEARRDGLEAQVQALTDENQRLYAERAHWEGTDVPALNIALSGARQTIDILESALQSSRQSIAQVVEEMKNAGHYGVIGGAAHQLIDRWADSLAAVLPKDGAA